jgi:hypothetical protein
MKNRTRLFLVVAVGVLVVGLGTGLVASYVGLQNFGIIGGDGPEELAYVPADARMVAFANVRDLANSELRQKVKAFQPNPDGEQEFEKETGINIERDIDHVIVAAWAEVSPQGPPLVLARGAFDQVRIEGLVREHGGTVEDYNGKRLLVIASHNQQQPSMVVLTFAEPGLAVFGDAASVRRAIDTKAAGTGNLRGNADVMTLIKDVDDGNAWAVARFDALSVQQLPKEIANQLPPITWFSASGHVNGGVSATIRAEAKDEKSAEDLRQVVQGFVALARLQLGQRAEFAELVNSLELGGQGKTVSIGFSIPSSVIDALGAHTAEKQRELRPWGAPRPAAPQAPTTPSL